MESLAALPLRVASHSLLFASWIDNLYSLAHDASTAVRNLEVFESILVQKWALHFKADSKKVISAKREKRGCDVRAWKWSSPFEVLGLLVGEHGEPEADLTRAIDAIWVRFWCGAGSRRGRSLSLKLRLTDLERICFSACSRRCSWWCVGKTLLKKVASVQRALVACCMRLPRESGETDDVYCRRRGREAGRVADGCGCWARKVAGRVVSWDQHLLRGHKVSWATILRQHQDSAWLQAQRRLHSSLSVFFKGPCAEEIARKTPSSFRGGLVFAASFLRG